MDLSGELENISSISTIYDSGSMVQLVMNLDYDLVVYNQLTSSAVIFSFNSAATLVTSLIISFCRSRDSSGTSGKNRENVLRHSARCRGVTRLDGATSSFTSESVSAAAVFDILRDDLDFTAALTPLRDLFDLG